MPAVVFTVEMELRMPRSKKTSTIRMSAPCPIRNLGPIQSRMNGPIRAYSRIANKE
ncbi:hypothetical protein D3C73_1484660 [compost metagenome]